MNSAAIHTEASETFLLERMAADDANAFHEIHNRYWKKIYGAAFRRIPDHQVVKDLLQDIFANLWLRRASLDVQQLEPYLMGAVRNMVLKHLEKTKHYTPIDDLLVEITYSNSPADLLVLRDELIRAYHDVVSKLTPSQRRIVELRFEQDLSTEEIAQVLQISRKTVQNQLRTALIAIRSTLLATIVSFLLQNFSK